MPTDGMSVDSLNAPSLDLGGPRFPSYRFDHDRIDEIYPLCNPTRKGTRSCARNHRRRSLRWSKISVSGNYKVSSDRDAKITGICVLRHLANRCACPAGRKSFCRTCDQSVISAPISVRVESRSEYDQLGTGIPGAKFSRWNSHE
jgi:hypothetical protein